MRLSQAWIVASKDFAMFRKKRNIVYSIIILPVLLTGLLSGVVWYIQHKGNGTVSPAELTVLLPAFTFFYLIMAGLIPSTIASYSIVGEKVEKSMEPLLATPTTDGEILLGKGLAAFVPAIVAVLGSSALFMGLCDIFSVGTLGYYFFPNWSSAVVLFLMVPLGVVVSVEWNILVSSRVSDVRIAQQIGGLMLLPYGGVYVGGELGLIPLGNTNDLLTIAAVLGFVCLLMLYAVQATFQREAILTRWK
jgi:ABC-2 type transport system permease protein